MPEPPLNAERLGEFLVKKGLLRTDQLEAGLAEQSITGEKLGLILNRSGFITRKMLVEAILELSPSSMHGEQHFSARVPGEVLIQTKTSIVAELDTQVFLSTLTDEHQVRHELQQYYPGLELVFVATSHEQMDAYLSEVQAMLSDDDSLVERMLRKALAEGASDVHITPRHHSYTVFFRMLGVRRIVHEGTLEEYNTLAARIKDLSRMDLAERRIPQDGSFSLDYDGKIVDMRVATSPGTSGEYIVIRLLDPDRVQPSLSSLGITRVAEWRKGTSRPDGLCLICGPTGSGKTTTLNATVKEMDRFSRAIYTLEDPVEYRIAYTGQVNVNPAVGLDFARGIRAFMRADPDVIIVGEIRDAETARNAVKAAETGHLVLGTLHTSSIHGALGRLRDLEVPAHELRYLLRSVLVQRLMRTLCTHCHGKGCELCFSRGYSSRTVVSECAYFPQETDVQALLEGKTSWPLLIEDALLKVKEGVTDAREFVRVFGEDALDLLRRENMPLPEE